MISTILLAFGWSGFLTQPGGGGGPTHRVCTAYCSGVLVASKVCLIEQFCCIHLDCNDIPGYGSIECCPTFLHCQSEYDEELGRRVMTCNGHPPA